MEYKKLNKTYTNKELSDYLNFNCKIDTLIDRLKVVYRPYICPFSIILSFIEEKDSLFDIGCGSGQFINLVMHFRRPLKIMGIEITDSLVKLCQKMINENRFDNVLVKKYAGFDLPPETQNYNVFSMIDVLHHIPRETQLDYMKNLYNSMKKGDRLILKDIDASSPLVLFNKLHDMLLSRQISREISIGNCRQIMQFLGFKEVVVTKCRTLVYPHYLLVLEK